MAHNRLFRKRFATLLLACLMLLSFAAFAACSTSEDEDDETTETRTDTQTFANANFEYFDDSDGSYLIGSAESWTNSTASNSGGTSASSSTAKSGIVDTSFDWGSDQGFYQAYADYLHYDELEEDDPDSAELEDAEYFKDIDNYYDIPGWDVVKYKLAKEAEEAGEEAPDLTNKEVIAEHAEEIAAAAKALNPGTPETAAEAEDEESGTHVLMIHNYRLDGLGTAQKYTSSTITLAAGTEAMFSVWVNTRELTYNEGNTFTEYRGAYIAVTNTVGGTSQNPLVVRNIITNGEWQQYTFYVKASDYASTTFAVELGLGRQDAGSSKNSYVQGYAFFDDLHYEVKTAGSFDTTGVPASQQVKLDLSYGSKYPAFDATKITEENRSFSLDLAGIESSELALTLKTDNEDGVAPGDYASTVNGVRPTADDRGNTIENSAPLLQRDIDRLTGAKTTDTGISGWKTASDLTSTSLPAALQDAFKNYSALPFGEKGALLLYSSQGAPYTTSATSDLFELAKDEYLLIRFWVKTSDLAGGTGATVSVVETDTETKTSIGAVDTTTLEVVSITDDYNGKKGKYGDTLGEGGVREDIFDGWQQCFFFVANTTDETISFSLQFNYGITSEFDSTTLASFVPGFAAFAGFEYSEMTEEQFNAKTTGTYAVEVALNGSDTSAVSSFDDVDSLDSEAIETGFGAPSNYKGTFGGSHDVGGDAINTATLGTAGLLDKDYAESYYTDPDNSAWLDILTNASWYTGALDQNNWWTTVFGSDSTRPLIIVNSVAQSYGFIARSDSSISTSSYSMITLRVKLSPGASANIYLIDTTADEPKDEDFDDPDYIPHSYTDTLRYSLGVSYRYDNSGNVVNLDPEDKNFSTRSNTLFYIQDNGLWLPKGVTDTGVYYANLANYGKDDDGNLIDSDKNVVYYASETEGDYYRYYDAENDEYSVLVRDFTAAENIDLTGAVLQDLRDEANDKLLMQTVKNDSDTVSDWIYVRFFIATGDESKSYRLEVWSGDRTGDSEKTNPANSFVAFEMVNYGTLDETTFNDNVSAMIDRLIEAYNADPDNADNRLRSEEDLIEAYLADPAAFANGFEKYGADVIYFLYSLYDDDDYASYDANYSDSTNSPYADYDATTYAQTVSYLRTEYTDDTISRTYYDTYVNYGASEKTVAASSDSSDDTTDDTTDNTPSYNVWLLAVSIVLAAVLIFTMIVLLIRKLLANLKRRPAKPTQTYDNKRKRYIRKLKLEEAEKDESSEDILPEDDEISEEDIYRVETDEEPAEPEAAEEPAEPAQDSAEEAQSESPAEEKKDE